jgi:hypothetical protein
MPAVRLIPKTDDAEFPYDAALAMLRALPGVELRPKDFVSLLEAGSRCGWTEEMLQVHEEMARRGRCFDFAWNGPPTLRGSLFEDNVFISVVDDEPATLRLVAAWARKLDVRVFQH